MTAEALPQQPDDITTQKAHRRRQCLKARQSIPPELWRQKSDRICAHLLNWPEFQAAQTVLAYCSFRQEPDLSPLIPAKPSWGLPRCVGKTLQWHRWSPQGLPLQVGAYGILEPHPETPTITPSEVDLILIPAIACDVRGYRLGYGGGFYDRLLSQPGWNHVPTMGVIFECTRLPQLPHHRWDRRLQGVCTESGLFFTAKP